jgi:polysaccharide deacetylase 2 family uncharacterized protein YibQ
VKKVSPPVRKQSSKTNTKQGKPKRRSRRRPGLEDGVRAALIAAVCISAVFFTAALIFILHSFTPERERETPAAVSPPRKIDRDSGPAVRDGPVPRPEPAQTPAARETPAPPAAPPELRERPADNPAPGNPAATSAGNPAAGNSAAGTPVAGDVPAGGTIADGVIAGGRVEAPPRPAHKGILVFMIDDAGNNLRELEPFLRFPGPLTIAVLPGLPYSAEAARRIRAAGKEVFLHQPMEALGGQDPGPGAVYAGMPPEGIRAVIERNLAEIGPVAGMNNHQGSKVTMDEKAMETILALCRENHIYFLDSRTTAETAAPAAAERLGITIGERDVFLDNVQQRASMIRSVEDGLKRAEQRGRAVMIGHTWSGELASVLTELYPRLREQGYSLATVSRIMSGE